MKAKTSITMDVDTLAKAREHDINVSATAEQAVSERVEEKSRKQAGGTNSEPDNDSSYNGNSVEDDS
jgi:post-segregation antitoxin (ccd killing protein)